TSSPGIMLCRLTNKDCKSASAFL
ncbi:hypothetical protein EC960932_5074, partial [Escherichia coli 96.0932]